MPAALDPAAVELPVELDEYIIILVSETDPRSWPTSPAEWNVEPLVRSERSTQQRRRCKPSWARW